MVGHGTILPMRCAAGEESLVSHDETLLPNGGYGWAVVASLAGIIAVSWGASFLAYGIRDETRTGMNTTYGVYTSFYIANGHFAAGTPFKYAWVGGCAVSTGLISGPLVRRLLCRWDERLQLVLGKCFSVSEMFTTTEMP